MKSTLTRRSFLKGGVAAACTLAASGAASAAAVNSPGGEHLATLIDISKCVGCEGCVDACAEANSGKFPTPKKPFPKMVPARVPVEDWSDRQDTTDRLTPYNWLFIQHATITLNGEETDISIPRRCMHCVNPPCVKLCPWGAARQLDNGLSVINADTCLGGSKCKKVCPWHIPQRQTGVGLYLDLMPTFAGNGVMYKCDRCYNRLAAGETPACIDACPEEVQTIGPRQEIITRAHELARETNGYIYGETENGGTNTIYVSPVSFEDLNTAMGTGPGNPHMKPVKNTMAAGNNLLKAMAIAPVAGLAAAATKYIASVKRERKEGETDV
jgi:formate dehydrogenase iron-sulfur subunit